MARRPLSERAYQRMYYMSRTNPIAFICQQWSLFYPVTKKLSANHYFSRVSPFWFKIRKCSIQNIKRLAEKHATSQLIFPVIKYVNFDQTVEEPINNKCLLSWKFVGGPFRDISPQKGDKFRVIGGLGLEINGTAILAWRLHSVMLYSPPLSSIGQSYLKQEEDSLDDLRL